MILRKTVYVTHTYNVNNSQTIISIPSKNILNTST